MQTPKFYNPWHTKPGFVDLGPYESDGVHFDLYCFPGRDKDVIEIGARFGEQGDYMSASVRPSVFSAEPRLICHGYLGAIKEAVTRMAQRGLFKSPVYNLDGRCLFSPGMGLEKLCELWEKLGDVPVTEDGCLEEPFEHFNRGVDREEVWRWFETQNPGFVVGDMLQGISPLQQ